MKDTALATIYTRHFTMFSNFRVPFIALLCWSGLCVEGIFTSFTRKVSVQKEDDSQSVACNSIICMSADSGSHGL